jgi:hypothetical protein
MNPVTPCTRDMAQSRTQRRLHAETCIAGSLAALAVVVLNLYAAGERNLPGVYGWIHGWPAAFSARHFSYLKARPDGFDDILNSRPWFDGKHVIEFWPWALAFNVVIGLVLVLATCRAVNRLCSQGWVFRFSVKGLLAGVAWIACVVAIAVESGRDLDRDVHTAAVMIAYVALALFWITVFDIVNAGWRIWASKRNTSGCK